MDTVCCGFGNCAETATRYCTCTAEPSVYCLRHLSLHLESNGTHSISPAFRELSVLETQQVNACIKCMEDATRLAVDREKKTVDKQVQLLIQQIRELFVVRTRNTQAINEESRKILGQLKRLKYQGISVLPRAPSLTQHLGFHISSKLLQEAACTVQMETEDKEMRAFGLFCRAEQSTSLAEQYYLYGETANLYQDLNLALSRAKSLERLASVYHKIGRDSEVISTYERAGSIYSELGYLYEHANVLQQLGGALSQAGKLQEAANVYFQSVSLYQYLAAKSEEAKVWHDLSTVQHELQWHDLAKESIGRSIQLWKQIGSSEKLAKSLHSLGTYLVSMHLYREAESVFEECVQICKGLPNKRWLAIALVTQGRVLSEAGRHSDAVTVSQKAAQIAEQLNMQCTLADSVSIIGMSLLNFRLFEQAASCFKSVTKVYHRLDLKEDLASTFGCLARLNEEIDDHSQVCEYSDQQLALYSQCGRRDKYVDTLRKVISFLERVDWSDRAIPYQQALNEFLEEDEFRRSILMGS